MVGGRPAGRGWSREEALDRDRWVDAVVLSRVRGVGDRAFKNLIDAFGSAGAVLRAGPAALSSVEGVGPGLAAAIRGRLDLEGAQREVVSLMARGWRLIPYGDPEYPALLAQIADPPAVLYVAGDLLPEDQRAVAVVGSRKASTSGVRFARRLAQDLAAGGITVVSGLAQGIDAAAHQGAVEGGGRTLAVFGAGLDVIYPGWNADLAIAVRERGAWLSEVPLGSEPRAHHFPRRNRVISGLSLGVVVVEAAERSGSLITARAALDQGREVFAVPGLPGSYNARGTHGLLRSGAKLVERVEDILEEIPEYRNAPKASTPLPVPELPGGLEGLWAALEDAPVHIDDLAARAKASPAEASAGLMELCLRGSAQEWPGKRYSRVVT